MLKSAGGPADGLNMNERHRCTAVQAAHRLGLPLHTVIRLMRAGILSSDHTTRGPSLCVQEVEHYANRRRRVGIR